MGTGEHAPIDRGAIDHAAAAAASDARIERMDHIGVTRNTANEKVRAARALKRLPLISAAMARGEISFSKVRALTRAGTAETRPSCSSSPAPGRPPAWSG